jgi:hypothetical protein
MKEYILLLASLLVLPFTFISCDIDNYTEPTAEISGQVIDAITGKPIQSQQPEGFEIRLVEDGYTSPNLFWGKADGSFKNVRLFPVKYSVKPTNGPFVDPEEQTVTLPKTGLMFNVQPYVNIEGSMSIEGDKFKYSVNLKRGAGEKIIEIMCIISDGNPNVSSTVYVSRSIMDVSGIPDGELLASAHSGTITDYVPVSGKTYYVRFAAKTSSSARYNYSEPVKLVN